MIFLKTEFQYVAGMQHQNDLQSLPGALNVSATAHGEMKHAASITDYDMEVSWNVLNNLLKTTTTKTPKFQIKFTHWPIALLCTANESAKCQLLKQWEYGRSQTAPVKMETLPTLLITCFSLHYKLDITVESGKKKPAAHFETLNRNAVRRQS